MRKLIEVTEEYQPAIAHGLFRARWEEEDGSFLETEHPFPDIIWRNVVWEELARYMDKPVPTPIRDMKLRIAVAGWLPWAVWALACPFLVVGWRRPFEAIMGWLVAKACDVEVIR